MTEAPAAIRLDPADNVVVARRDIAAGEYFPREDVTALEEIPAGHKMATTMIRKGSPVLKYATVIGYAGADCPPGSYLHAHNVLMD